MSIIRYAEQHWPLVREYLDAHWRKGHPLTQKDLFDWQYRGFSAMSPSVCRLWIEKGELIGFIGGIPGEYILRGEKVPGLAVALWSVRPDCMDRGIGFFLIQEMEADFPVCLILGATPETTVKYGSLAGYDYAEGLNRYVFPLAPLSFPGLLRNGWADLSEAQAWAENCAKGLPSPLDPEKVSPADLAEIYRLGTMGEFGLSAFRTEKFWEWRYLNNVGFKYHLFGGKGRGGIVVARVETSISEDSQLHGARILRIVEILPERGPVWRGDQDEALRRLVGGVLAWAREQGCWAADFQIANERLAPFLLRLGFKRQEDGGGVADILHTFSPVSRRAMPINYLWRTRGEALSKNELYLVKSDGDMDRPNIWPAPAVP